MKKTVLLWIVLLFGLPISVYADIRVTPTITQLNLSPGEERSDSFLVSNYEGKQTSIEIEIEDLFKQPTEDKSIDVNSWIEVESRIFNICPGETKKIGYKVKTPAGYAGELRFSVFFATQDRAIGNVGIRKRFGVAIYVAIKGTEIVKAEISDISISEIKSSAHGKDIGFSVIVQNKSNVHIRPQGKVLIKDNEDNVVKELLLPYGFPIMPNSTHPYYVAYENCDLLPGRYKAIALIQYGDTYGLSKGCENQTFFSIK